MAPENPVLVANAPIHWTPRLTAKAAAAEPLLAADGGANHLARIGLRPLAVIGDLDSITESTVAWVGSDRLVRRPDQDRTDLDKALEYAIEELDLERLTVLAALGGRPDHDLGNLGLLARLGMNQRLVFVGEEWTAMAVSGEVRLEAKPGETWSFWSYDPSVRATVEGVRWPLENSAVDASGHPSISNEATANFVSILAAGGSVVVMRSMQR